MLYHTRSINKCVADTARNIQRRDGGGVESDSRFEKSSEIQSDPDPPSDHENIHDNNGNRTCCNGVAG